MDLNKMMDILEKDYNENKEFFDLLFAEVRPKFSKKN